MPSFGEELRRERELRSISLREIAEATKVNLRYLEAIERNQFEALPGGVFNRGFVRAYAEFIGVDPEAMVNAYLLEEQSKTAPQTAEKPEVLRGERERRVTKAPREKPAPAQERRRAKRPGRRSFGLWIFALLVAVALIVVGLWAAGLADLESWMRMTR